MLEPSNYSAKDLAALRELHEVNLLIGSGVDAKRYCAQHEDCRDVLDDLVRRRLVRSELGKYWVSMIGLSLIGDDVSRELFDRFEKLLSIMRAQYKKNLDADLKVADLASLADLSYADTAEALEYMIELPWWSGRSNEFHNSVNAHVSPSERILDHKTFEGFLAEAQREAMRAENLTLGLGMSASQPGELDQKSGILLSARQAGKDFPDLQSKLSPKKLPIAVVYLDVDKFKELNTRFTNKIVDDRVLNDLQRHLLDITSDRGNVYRHGGDEFIIILPNHSLEEAKAFCERLRSSFECLRFSVESESIGVTISVGLAVWPDHGANYDGILEEANKAQIVAKGKRNTIEVAREKRRGQSE
jgi:diguanylate cyclase (GGDEF)-like protein